MLTEINPKRGGVWRVELEPTRGDEMKKTRPCVAVNQPQTGRLALRLVVPLTGWQNAFASFPWCVQVFAVVGTGLSKTSAADVFQMRSVSLLRMQEKIGTLPDEDAKRIVEAIAYAVGAGASL